MFPLVAWRACLARVGRHGKQISRANPSPKAAYNVAGKLLLARGQAAMAERNHNIRATALLLSMPRAVESWGATFASQLEILRATGSGMASLASRWM